jgi:hypothetical protein
MAKMREIPISPFSVHFPKRQVVICGAAEMNELLTQPKYGKYFYTLEIFNSFLINFNIKFSGHFRRSSHFFLSLWHFQPSSTGWEW